MEGQSRPLHTLKWGFVFSGQVMEDEESAEPVSSGPPRAPCQACSFSGLYAAVVESHSSPAQVRRSWMESNCWLGPLQALSQGTGQKGWTPAGLSSARPPSNFPGHVFRVSTPLEPYRNPRK